MKFSLNSNSLRKNLSNEEIAGISASAGFQAMEWGLPAFEEAAGSAPKMCEAARKSGLEVLSFINAGSILKPEKLVEWGKIAEDNGVGMLRVAHPWYAWNASEAQRQPDDFDRLVKMTRDALFRLCDLTSDSRVRYVFETHSGAVFASPWAAKYLLEELPPERFGVIYDPANTCLEGFVRPRGAMELLGPYLAYIHAKNMDIAWTKGRQETKRASLESGAVDYAEVMFALKLHRRDVWFSFEEMYSPVENVVEELRSGREYLERLYGEVPGEIQSPELDFNYR